MKQPRLSRVAAALAGACAAVSYSGFGAASAARPSAVPTNAAPAPPRFSFFAGYTGHDIADPGLHLGAEYALFTAQSYQSFLLASLFTYRDPRTETGYALHVRWGQRYTADWGLTFESALGVGGQYTRYDTTDFVFRDDVARVVEQHASRFGFCPHLSFGPGYDFQRLLRIPFQIYARAGAAVLYPDINLAFQASLLTELGGRWTLPQ